MKYKYVEKGKKCDICGRKISLDKYALWPMKNHLVVKRYDGMKLAQKYDVCMGCIKEWERLSKENDE